MTDINSITIIGRVTKNPDLTYTQGNMAILKFSIANNRRKKTAEGQYEDDPSFFDCTMFGKSAENIDKYLSKGKQVAILGELRQERWVDRDTQQNRSKVGIMVFSIELLGGKDDTGTQDASRPTPRPSAQPYRPQAPRASVSPSRAAECAQDPPRDTSATDGPEQFDDDDIPF